VNPNLRAMRIISFNANGIRSAANKGFLRLVPHAGADVLCLQETKAQEHQRRRPATSSAARLSRFFKRRDAPRKATAASRSISRASRMRCAPRWAGRVR
jgi:hypothetical protein